MLANFWDDDEIMLMLEKSICQLLRNCDDGYIYGDMMLIILGKYPYCSCADIRGALGNLEKDEKIVYVNGYYKTV